MEAVMSSLVYVKNPNGTTYVYSNESYWDKETKSTRHKRKCIGKVDPVTGDTVPTRKKKVPSSQKQESVLHCESLTVGPSLLLNKAAKETGVRDVLDSIFEEDASRILTCAYYLASERQPLCYLEQWSARNKHPLGSQLTDQRISELLCRITPTLQQTFFQKWVQHCYGKGYFAMDITSVSSYSEFIDFVRWGYNRDGEDLPQINLLIVTSEDTRLPVYFRILSGALKDVSSLKESLKNLDLLGSKAIRLVMDKGFYSESNVDAMYESHYRFSIGVPFTSSLAKDAVEVNRGLMDTHHNLIQVGDDELYAVTKLIKRKGHRCYVHTYYDSLKAESEKKKFNHKLKICYDELVDCQEKSENKAFYSKYYIVKELPKRGRRVLYNEEAISRYRQNTIGWFIMISNDIKDATAALQVYRDKDAVEKSFDDLKNNLDMKRLRIHSNTAMEGRVFIQFISLILMTYLRNILRDNGWTKNHNLQEIFSEMKAIQQVTVGRKRSKLFTTSTKRQQEILDLYQIIL